MFHLSILLKSLTSLAEKTQPLHDKHLEQFWVHATFPNSIQVQLHIEHRKRNPQPSRLQRLLKSSTVLLACPPPKYPHSPANFVLHTSKYTLLPSNP